MKVSCLPASVLLLFLPTLGSAAESGGLTETFTQLEKAFATGYQQKNVAALEALLAPEYALIVSARPDRPIPRAEWLALLPSYNVRRFEIRGVQVRCLSGAGASISPCELAAVSSINTQEADVGGQDRSGEFFLVDIWARRGGKWMVTSRYSGRTEATIPSVMK